MDTCRLHIVQNCSACNIENLVPNTNTNTNTSTFWYWYWSLFPLGIGIGIGQFWISWYWYCQNMPKYWILVLVLVLTTRVVNTLPYWVLVLGWGPTVLVLVLDQYRSWVLVLVLGQYQLSAQVLGSVVEWYPLIKHVVFKQKRSNKEKMRFLFSKSGLSIPCHIGYWYWVRGLRYWYWYWTNTGVEYWYWYWANTNFQRRYWVVLSNGTR